MSSLSRGTWIEINGIKTRHGPYGSSLSRGTWIEMVFLSAKIDKPPKSSLSRGTWIEMWASVPPIYAPSGRPSHEGRGLKSHCPAIPPRDARRPSHEGRGLKLPRRCPGSRTQTSSLSRGTWIEILMWSALARLTTCRPSHEGRGLK